MKNDLTLTTLDKVCQFQNGFAFKSNTFKDNGVPVLRISNIQKDKIDLNKIVYINPNDYKEDLSKYKVYKGDLLIAMSGATTGKIGFNNFEEIFFLNQRVGKFKPSELLIKKYLYYFLISKVEENLKISLGAAQPNLSTDQIKSFKLPLGSVDQQKQIVAKLDQAFAAINTAKLNVEKNLENAKELFQSKINQIFSYKGEGWVERKLGEVASLMTGGTPKRKNKEYFENGEINWLVSGDIHKKEIFECEGKITQLGLESSNARYLPLNSVMIALNGQGKTRGTVALLRMMATCNQSLVSIYPNDINQLRPEYIYTALDARYQEIRELTGDGGNDRRGLNMPLIRNIKIFYPENIQKQDEIIKQIQMIRNKTESLKLTYQQEFDSLEELKKSILEKAFNGEL